MRHKEMNTKHQAMEKKHCAMSSRKKPIGSGSTGIVERAEIGGSFKFNIVNLG